MSTDDTGTGEAKEESEPINLSAIPSETVEEQAKPFGALPPLSKVGYNLSRFILWIIAGFIVFLIIISLLYPFYPSHKIDIPNQVSVSDSTFNRNMQIIKAIQEENKNYRDFIYSIAQMVLLNLLLPTLTAVLGYIFGSKSENHN